MNHTHPKLMILPNKAEVQRTAAEHIAAHAAERIAATGRFTMVLAGGTTPRGLYAHLASEPCRSQIAWEHVFVVWGDERYVPHNHPDSNYALAHTTLLAHVPIPPDHIYPVPTHNPDIHTAAQEYQHQIDAVLDANQGHFDLAIQGMGADGHTASLFPHHPVLALPDTCLVAAVENAPKPPPQRMTLTAAALNRASHILFLVTGQDKASTLHDVLLGDYTPDHLPAQRLRPPHGTVIWMVDSLAMKWRTDLPHESHENRVHP